jgi:hypothetical protein
MLYFSNCREVIGSRSWVIGGGKEDSRQKEKGYSRKREREKTRNRERLSIG